MSFVANKRFGRLKLVRLAGRNRFNHKLVLCQCDCGKKSTKDLSQVVNGYTRSCGCLHLEKIAKGNPKHLLYGTPAYHTWAGMIQRCTNKKCPEYRNYGARGITVCERWLDFRNFYEDMGPRPAGLTLERIKNHLGYFKANCCWATRATQQRNTRRTVKIKWRGKVWCYQDLCAEHGLNACTVKSRLKKGISLAKALLIPVRGKEIAA